MRARRAIDVSLAALAAVGLVACGASSDGAPPQARPTSATQCLDDGEQRHEGYPLRLAVPERHHRFPSDHIVLDVCFPAPEVAPVQVEFELSGLDGTVTPMDTRIEHPDRPDHMLSAVASLRSTKGSGRIIVRITFEGITQGDAVVVNLSDGTAEVTED